MFCTNCGKEIPDISNFCTYCGSKVKKTEENINVQETQEKNIENTQKTIKVIFHRMKKFIGCAVPISIYIDKKIVGSLDNDGTLEVDVPYGTHNIILEMWSGVNEQQLTFSEEYSKVYLDVKIKMGAITNKPEIISIKNEK